MSNKVQSVIVTRWQGSGHPSQSAIIRLMNAQNLRPYIWNSHPNQRQAVHSHGSHTVLYVVEGSLEIQLPDENKTVILHHGDRIDIPASVRHATIVRNRGVTCAEATIAPHRR